MPLRALLVALVALAAVASAAPAQELTVYSSLPLQGTASAQTRAIVAGAQRALADAGGQAGGRPIRFVSLDSSTRGFGAWTPERASTNARRAAADPSTIAYLGEFNSGASAIAIPITNDAGILQVSPTNTAPGLTTRGAGVDVGDPDRYYPTGTRTFGRIVPHDHVQGRAGAELLERLRARRVLVIDDGELYGRGVAREAAAGLRRRGIRVVGTPRINPRASNFRRVAWLAHQRRADAIYFGGITANGAVQLWKDVTAANTDIIKVGSDGIAEAAFVDPRAGGIPTSVTFGTYVTVPTLAPWTYPQAGRSVLRALGDVDIYALYGYEAMAVILDAINRGGPTRNGTVGAFFATKDRASVLGRYSITPTGDTTITRFGVYRIVDDELSYTRSVTGTPR